MNFVRAPSIHINPHPIIRVPGSMPRIILEFFCRGNAIFDCGVEQKYQINSQLCCRADHNVFSFLYCGPPVTQTAELEGIIPSDVERRNGKTTMEIILYVLPDGGKLGAGNS